MTSVVVYGFDALVAFTDDDLNGLENFWGISAKVPNQAASLEKEGPGMRNLVRVSADQTRVPNDVVVLLGPVENGVE